MNTHQQPSSRVREEIIEWMYKGLPRGKTIPNFDHLLDALLTSHSEAIRERVEGMRRDQKKKKESDPYFTGCGACGGSYPAICGCKEVNEALDDILALLTDKK